MNDAMKQFLAALDSYNHAVRMSTTYSAGSKPSVDDALTELGRRFEDLVRKVIED